MNKKLSAPKKTMAKKPLRSAVPKRLHIQSRDLAAFETTLSVPPAEEIDPLLSLSKREGKVIMPPSVGKQSKHHAAKDHKTTKKG